MTKPLNIKISDQDRQRLERLCVAMGLSPERGKSITISRLINHAKVDGRTPELKKLPSIESIELLKNEYENMSKLGGNLNQLVHLLQIRKLRLDTGESEELVVEADFLVAVLKEINKEVDNIKAEMKTFKEKF